MIDALSSGFGGLASLQNQRPAQGGNQEQTPSANAQGAEQGDTSVGIGGVGASNVPTDQSVNQVDGAQGANARDEGQDQGFAASQSSEQSAPPSNNPSGARGSLINLVS